MDEVVTKLGESIEAVECQFTDFIFMKNNKNHVVPVIKLKKAGEAWVKRTKTTDSNREGYTFGSPNLNLAGMMNARLLSQSNNENLDNVFMMKEKSSDNLTSLTYCGVFENSK